MTFFSKFTHFDNLFCCHAIVRYHMMSRHLSRINGRAHGAFGPMCPCIGAKHECLIQLQITICNM